METLSKKTAIVGVAESDLGKVPHKSESMVRTLAMQMLDPIVPPSQARPDLPITPELERVVMKGLAKKRDERYPDMADFLSDIERACPGVPTGVPAPEQSGPLQLVPAPPGADPRAMSGLPTLHDEPSARVAAPPDAPTQKREPRSKPPTGSSLPTQRDEGPRATGKRVANEPRFVTSERPMTFDHVFEDDGRAT